MIEKKSEERILFQPKKKVAFSVQFVQRVKNIKKRKQKISRKTPET